MIGSQQGFSGFLHPEGVYDDPKGGRLRREIYPRLKYHFQFDNELKLFSEVHHCTKFSINIYQKEQLAQISFQLIANLYIPKTIYESYQYIGSEPVGGIKDGKSWNTRGHKDRILTITEKELSLFAQLYDKENTSYSEARLPSLHARQLISVLEKFAAQPRKLGDLKGEYMSTVMFDETYAQRDGYIKRKTSFPRDPEHLILSGPLFFVGNPLYKTPRGICSSNQAYDPIDLTNIPADYLPRTNYVPIADMLPDGSEDLTKYREKIPRVPWKEPGELQGKRVTEYYRLIVRKMLSQSGERTLTSSIIPPKSAHIHGAMSFIFKRNSKLLLALSTNSLVFDFYLKSTGVGNFSNAQLKMISQIDSKKLLLRLLLINCLTNAYASLWSDSFDPNFTKTSWTKEDPRLDHDHFKNLTSEWTWDTPLRTDYERRQALVEIDVLVAQAMGLTLDELQSIYRIQFPVMQQYEKETYYDQKGRIVFTVNKGLSGVGFPRKGNPRKDIVGWEDICDMTSGTVSRTVIDDTLPEGPVEREIVYHAPFVRCDRESDYATAWEEFERREMQ
jgi:hypothetical protein